GWGALAAPWRGSPTYECSSRSISRQAAGQYVADDRVRVLDQLISTLLGGEPDTLVDQVLQNAAVEAEQADRDGTSAGGHFNRPYEVPRVTTRRDHDQHVVVPREVVELARKNLVVAVVVGEGGEPGCVVAQAHDPDRGASRALGGLAEVV